MNGKNILLVDDVDKITSLVKLMLLPDNQFKTITTARNSHEAAVILCTQQIDVVILDFLPGKGNGIDFLKWIKEKSPEISVVIFTIHSDEFHRNLARLAGADHFLDKYSQFEEIPVIVSQLIKSKLFRHEKN